MCFVSYNSGSSMMTICPKQLFCVSQTPIYNTPYILVHGFFVGEVENFGWGSMAHLLNEFKFGCVKSKDLDEKSTIAKLEVNLGALHLFPPWTPDHLLKNVDVAQLLTVEVTSSIQDGRFFFRGERHC